MDGVRSDFVLPTLTLCEFSIGVPLYTEWDMFSQTEIHFKTHNNRQTNTHLLMNRGQVMTQAQMFPKDNFADLLAWMSAICH